MAKDKVDSSLRIRKAEPEDLGNIMNIYAYARKFMAEHGNAGQWGTNFPPPGHDRKGYSGTEKLCVC